MNETSRGGGGGSSRDPPIGGFMIPPSSGASSHHSQGNHATSSANNDDCGGLTPLSHDLDHFGEGMTLSRLLAGDSPAWDFDPLNPNGGGNGPHSNNNQYRPWECDLPSITSMASAVSSGIPTSVTSIAPPNVLAPHASAVRASPLHHHQFYQHPHHPAAPAHHFIDQRLPSFQSQFHQENPHAMFAAAAAVNSGQRGLPSHYPISSGPIQPLLDGHHPFPPHASTYHHLQPRPPTYGIGAHNLNPNRGRKVNDRPPSATSSSNMVEAHPTLTAQLRKKSARTTSLEGMDTLEARNNPPDTPGQVAAISSTEPTLEKLGSSHPLGMVGRSDESNNFKSPGSQQPSTPGSSGNGSQPASSMAGGGDSEKGTKKKRKRCGECIGCQKKDNCGDCAPCRNDKSHQICKLRRCERLTEKKPKKPNPRSKNANGSFNSEFGAPVGKVKRGRGSKAAAAAAAVPTSRADAPNTLETPRPENNLQTSTNSSSASTPTGSSPFTSTAGSGGGSSGGGVSAPFVDNSHTHTSSSWGTASQNTPSNPPSSSGIDPATQQWQQQHYPMAPPRMTSLDFQQSNGGASGSSFFEQAFHRPSPTLGNAPGGGGRVPSNGSYAMEASSLPSPNLNSGGGAFLGLNGNPPPGATALGYNLAVNTSPHPALRSHPSPRGPPTPYSAAAAHQQLHQSGNSPPGYPPRPTSGSSLLSYNNYSLSGGYPGLNLGTEPPISSTTTTTSRPHHYNGHSSPDSTTELHRYLPPLPSIMGLRSGTPDRPVLPLPTPGPPSFLACSAAEMPPTPRLPSPEVLAPMPGHQEWPCNLSRTHNSGFGRISAAPSTSDQKRSNIMSQEENTPRQTFSSCSAPIISPQNNSTSINNRTKSIPRPENSDKHHEAKEKVRTNLKPESPPCDCKVDQALDAGPYYTHLGVAQTIQELRAGFEARTGYQGKAIRIEKARYCSKEGKTKLGCPIAKYVIRRSGEEEKLLVVTKHRKGHTCPNSWIVVSIVAWEGVRGDLADYSYDNLRHKLANFGKDTQRQCGTNKPHTCVCQGTDNQRAGASFSFGCSWSLFYNMCKYAKSPDVNKFKLNQKATAADEKKLEDNLQIMATELAPLYQAVAPDSYNNQVAFSDEAQDCRIGRGPGRPFSGVTSVVDFCAHAHKDVHNMNAGCTVVVTLTKPENRMIGVKPHDEQLHVLSYYAPESTDEFGSQDAQLEKIRNGSLEVLEKFERTTYTREAPPKKRHNQVRGDRKRFLDEWIKSKKKGTPFNPMKPTNKKRPKSEKSYKALEPVESEQSVETTTLYLPQDSFATDWMYDIMAQDYSYGPNMFPNASWNMSIPQTDGAEEVMGVPTDPCSPPKVQNSNMSLLYPSFSQFEQPPIYTHEQPFGQVEQNHRPQQKTIKEEPPKPKFNLYHTTAEENFQDPNIGGMAIALTHGSVLFECAKHELHATTALKHPDRFNPTRIGLVFYQHRSLNLPKHGWEECKEKALEKNLRDYEAWKEGQFVPTARKLQKMREDGFEFPEDVQTISNANDLCFDNIKKPDLSFLGGRLGTESVSPSKNRPQ